MKHITIIGGGLSGLSASCYLAKRGYGVTIVEKNEDLGGRLGYIKEDGFTFDLGPSWYWMPDVFESFFNDFDKKVSDYYKLERLDPSYKFFLPNSSIGVPANIDELYDVFDNIEDGSSNKLKEFLDQARRKYEISMHGFINLPNISAKEYFSLSIIKYIFSLDLLKSLRKHIASFFSSKTLRDMLEFPSMFLGGSPKNTPALYSLMNYADIVQGTWYPMGGMYKVTSAFTQLSKELGVKHITNEEIVEFNIKSGYLESIRSSNNNTYSSDYFICCSEYPHVQMNLVDDRHRSYEASYWNSRNVAPSALIFYLGVSERIKEFEHHNLFFDADFDNHLNDIFNNDKWPSDPLFYVCCPSKTDESVVPDNNNENLFILVPIAAGSIDTNEVREQYFQIILNRIELKTGQSIKDKIITKKSFSVNDFKNKYHAYKGNAYGLANTLYQTALFKPKVKDKKINNLFYSGHFTVPGPGLPPAIISGKIAAEQIIKDDQL